MALNKNNLGQIEKMFDRFELQIQKQIELTEKRLRKDLTFQIRDVEDKLSAKVEASENKVIAIISREINDLAEINREVIKRVNKVDELEKRIIRIETKLGIKAF